MLRDPEATMISKFKFEHSKHNGYSDKLDVNDWALEHFLPSEDQPFEKTIWNFYLEIWKCRKIAHVLIVVYEKLKTDVASYIPRIASFMGLPVPASDKQARIEELCSFDWMSKHQHLFDDHHMHGRHEAFKAQFPELEQQKAAGKASVKGKGKGKDKGRSKGKDDKPKPTPKVGLQLGDEFNTKVNEETRQLLAKAWREHVTPVTGHQTYEEMAADLSSMHFNSHVERTKKELDNSDGSYRMWFFYIFLFLMVASRLVSAFNYFAYGTPVIRPHGPRSDM